MLALSRRRACEARQESLAGSQMLETLRDSPLICSVIGGEQKMDWNQVEGNWKEVKGKVKQKWAKLTDDDLADINGQRDQLEGRLQKRYGYAKDQARKDVDDWFSTLP